MGNGLLRVAIALSFSFGNSTSISMFQSTPRVNSSLHLVKSNALHCCRTTQIHSILRHGFLIVLGKVADVEMRIYSANGNLVRTLELGRKEIGIYQNKARAAYWDGKNDSGEAISSGVYFYELRVGSDTFVRKTMLLK